MRIRRALAVVSFWALAATWAQAQCQLEWQDGPQVPGTDNRIWHMSSWDPDGSGPLPPKLVAAGEFSFAGDIEARSIVALDFASNTWAPFGPGLVGRTNSLVSTPGGKLIAAGFFTLNNWASFETLMEWNGTSWLPIAPFTSTASWAEAYAAAVAPNGDLIVAGRFDAVAGVAADNIARWDGSSWNALGLGVNDIIYDIAAMPNGDIIATGSFTSAGGAAIAGIARWDGQSWLPLGSGAAPSAIHCLLPMPNGDLLVGGDFTAIASVNARHIARWNGSTWSALGNGPTSYASVMMLDSNGDIVAGGDEYGVTGNMRSVARWDGNNWQPLGNGMGLGVRVTGIVEAPDGSLLLGGRFNEVAGRGAMNIVRWDGSNWSAIGHGISGYSIHDVAAAANGDLVVGGDFKLSDSSSANIARWNGVNWTPYGPGLSGHVRAVAELPNGDIVAGGEFNLATGSPADYVARWDGSNWVPMGSTISQPVRHLTVMANGDLIAAGNFPGYIASWNGTSWAPLGAGLSGPVESLLSTPYGSCVVGGKFLTAGTLTCNGVALWTGSQWIALGSGLTTLTHKHVTHLVNTANDGIVAAGYFDNGTFGGSSISYWDWTDWHPQPASGTIWALLNLPNSDLLVGEATGAVPAGRFSRWDGTAWSSLPWPSATYQGINNLTTRPDGSVAVTASGPIVVKILASTCPATSTPVGSGCNGTGGNNTLVAQSLPWIGSQFQTEGQDLTPLSLVLELNGLASTAIPLPAILPEGGIGCSLLTVPDFSRLHVPTSNTLQTRTAIPDSSALIGGVWHQQLVALEFGPLGNLTLVTSSNALRLQIGSF